MTVLKYPCLVLDHDDTVVQSETTINFPYFCYILDQFRPGSTITLEEYIQGCFTAGFAGMCRQRYNFTEEELEQEYQGWKGYVRTHIPAPYAGIEHIIRRHKEAGGTLCVVSHSSRENILRDYRTHFGMEPDSIYGWEYPEHQRKPSTYPLEHIMQTYGFSREDLLVVDDLKPAWQMCRDAGVAIAFAAWSKTEVPEILAEMEGLCDFSFRTPRDLEEFLFNPLDNHGIIP